MIFCTNCGAKLIPDAAFCTKCGQPVKPIAVSRGTDGTNATSQKTSQNSSASINKPTNTLPKQPVVKSTSQAPSSFAEQAAAKYDQKLQHKYGDSTQPIVPNSSQLVANENPSNIQKTVNNSVPQNDSRSVCNVVPQGIQRPIPNPVPQNVGQPINNSMVQNNQQSVANSMASNVDPATMQPNVSQAGPNQMNPGVNSMGNQMNQNINQASDPFHQNVDLNQMNQSFMNSQRVQRVRNNAGNYEIISSVLWLIVAISQVIMVINGTLMLKALFIALWNFSAVLTGFVSASLIKQGDQDVPESYRKNLWQIIGMIIFNLLLGGYFGVIAAVMDLFNRYYILKNEDCFNVEIVDDDDEDESDDE
ncbi:zinc-ribbon domain-containing protein [Companilactobacillus versmoldensis]|uniref:Zinc-ribbon domain-containing protein n=1 Tax=Companilactobacillus versmoldensis DSM 14857 = KCTC 3814 TaxID=1423815 RepID=A0A0R1SN84_9LACO|nr:zinc-ribbon domain-containing protein [Companilactobacillus versmoldensis]KRL67528.1 hypothetical protein FC27_GL001844 [Companilactobacillus versmoldensis DSM 14857 = KCTC 3814]